MKIVLDIENNKYEYEIKSLISAFFISAEFYRENIIDKDLYLRIAYELDKAVINIKKDNCIKDSLVVLCGVKSKDIIKIEQKIYEEIQFLYNKSLPWGILTGVRPVKIALKMLENGKSDEDIIDYYVKERYLSYDKAKICTLLAHKERELINNLSNSDMALYVNIPICPKRCNYCSFISKQSTDNDYIEKYVQALINEIHQMSGYFNNNNIASVYIGGGTPGILSAKAISLLIGEIRNNFNLKKCLEFTFEAGRADCIDDEKLSAIKSSGADRICINAQSMHDVTLDKIGRHIKVSKFYEAYEKAMKYDFIKNVDLIYGLEGENEEMFLSSLNKVIALNPENITLHSLSYKRNSQIFEDKNFISSYGFDKCYEILKNNNYHPYYLYRQKYTANGAENTGFSRAGYDGIYNRLIISERIGVIGLGAGAAGKIYDKETDNIKRVAGYKNIDLYIENTQDAIDKKLRTYGFI